MAPSIDPQTIYKTGGTANMPYTHCKTRIINLKELEIPAKGTEAEYRRLYHQISQFKTATARTLTDAISSVSLGIAPPVAFPTETVYGLGADATNRASIAGIFAAKGRPSDNPLIVHVASVQHLERLTGEPLPAVYSDLVKEHWPGPLTILVPVPKYNSAFAPNVHPGQQTIGFRVPQSKYARFFIAATGKSIAGPSANSSGKPSPTTAQHVFDDLNGKINFILDGGNCDVGVESTVVDGLCDPPLILRPGGLSQDDLIAHGRRHDNAWINVGIGYEQHHSDNNDAANGTNGTVTPDEAPRAPGMKYKHYAPQGQMILFNGPDFLDKAHTELNTLLETSNALSNGNASPHDFSIAILTSTTWSPFANLPVTTTTTTSSNPTVISGTHQNLHSSITVHSIALGQNPKQIAQNLFAALRTCDDLKCRFILAEAPTRQKNDGLVEQQQQAHQYDAVLERMRKAATSVVQ